MQIFTESWKKLEVLKKRRKKKGRHSIKANYFRFSFKESREKLIINVKPLCVYKISYLIINVLLENNPFLLVEIVLTGALCILQRTGIKITEMFNMKKKCAVPFCI